MAFELATAFVSIEIAQQKFSQQLQKIKGDFLGTVTSFTKMAGLIGLPLSALAGFSKLKEVLTESVSLAKEAGRVHRELAQAVEYIGNRTSFTTRQLEAYAKSLQDITGVSKTQIAAAMTQLLRFGELSEAVMKKATDVATDLSKSLHLSVEDVASSLGRALMDPSRGFATLRRFNIVLKEDQKEYIELLQKTGRVEEARMAMLSFVNVPRARATAGERRALGREERLEEIGKAIGPGLGKLRAGAADVGVGLLHDVLKPPDINDPLDPAGYLKRALDFMERFREQHPNWPDLMPRGRRQIPPLVGSPTGLLPISRSLEEARLSPAAIAASTQVSALMAQRRDEEGALLKKRIESMRAELAAKEAKGVGLEVMGLKDLNEAFQDAMNNTEKNPGHKTNELMRASIERLGEIAIAVKRTAEDTSVLASQANEPRERAVAND